MSSLSVHGVCKLLFDDYRGYKIPEGLIVHIADNLEEIEKGFHSARGSKEIIEDVLKNINSNMEIYRNKKEVDKVLGTVAQFLVKEVLVPGIKIIADGIIVGAQVVAVDPISCAVTFLLGTLKDSRCLSRSYIA